MRKYKKLPDLASSFAIPVFGLMEKRSAPVFHILIACLWFSFGSSASAEVPISSGQHDFDFEIGNWKAHVKKLIHPLSNSKEWEEFDGTVNTAPFMEGKGNLSEMNVVGAVSHSHIQIIAARLYNPDSKQWRIYGASAETGVFDPPQIGQFNGTRGEFYASDIFQGHAIFIRYVWQNLSATTTHFEQAFSSDGGKTWEVNWIYDGIRQRP